MFGVESYEGKDVWDFCRLMIDRNHQGNGYGRTVVRAVIEIMKNAKPEIRDIYISFVPENTAARHLYTLIGFRDVGMSPDGQEVLMHMFLSD